MCSIFAGNEEELFLRANKLYQSHDYAQALSLYEMIHNKGRAVVYNMGNCYFFLHDYPNALLHWMRAEKGATAQEKKAIQQNKTNVLTKMGMIMPETFLDSIKRFLDHITSFVSLSFLQLLFLILWYLCIFFVLQYGKKKKNIAFFLLISLCCVGSTLFVEHKKKSTLWGLIMAQKAPVFSAPDEEFKTSITVSCPDCVRIREARKGWYKIQYSGTIGWVTADALAII